MGDAPKTPHAVAHDFVELEINCGNIACSTKEGFCRDCRVALKSLEALITAERATLAAQLADAVDLLRELHANMNHQTGPQCCPSGRFLARIDGAHTAARPAGPASAE